MVGNTIDKNVRIIASLVDKTQKGFAQMNKNLKMLTTQTKNLNKNFQDFAKKTTNSTEKIGKASEKNIGGMGKKTLQFMRTFRMLGLSMMVGGYAIERIFKTIATSSINSFQQIMATNGFMNTNINVLAATWEYLKFTIGSALNTALGPVLPMIINIVNTVSDWIQKHSSLVGWLIIGAIAIGAFMAGIGLLIYLITGVASIITFFTGEVTAAGAASVIAGEKTATSAIGWSTLGSAILNVLAWVLAIVGIFAVGKGIIEAFSSGTDETSNSVLSLGDILKWIGQVLVFVFNLLEIGGKVIGVVIIEILDGLAIAMAAFVTAVETSINFVIGNIESFVNFFIKGINLAISGLNKLGANINAVPDLKLGKIDTSQNMKDIDAIWQHMKDKGQWLMNNTPGSLGELWSQSAIGGTTLPNAPAGPNTSDTGNNSNITINMNNSGIAKDTQQMMKDALNDSLKQIDLIKKQYAI